MIAIQEIQAVTVGRPAAEQLDVTNGWAVVESAFARAANIQLGRELLTVGVPSILNLPYGVLCNPGLPNFYQQFKPGTRVRVNGRHLYFPDIGIGIDASKAAVWSPELRLPLGNQDSSLMLARMTGVRQLAVEHASTGRFHGITFLLLQIDKLLIDDPGPDSALTRFQLAYFHKVTSLVAAIRSGEAELIFRTGLDLLGLGVGLTPSGDDVLSGLLTTLIVTAPKQLRQAAIRAAHKLAQRARLRTTSISGSYLRQSSQGYVTERFGNLLESIVVDGFSADQLSSRARKMLAHGATSGAEIVLGLLVGLSLVLEWNARQLPAGSFGEDWECQ